MMPPADQSRFIGRVLDGLPLKEKARLTNSWIATQLYSPERLPLRTIEAVGSTLRDCIAALERSGRDPSGYFFELVDHAFEP